MSDTLFTRDNLDSCLKELAKEIRKINGSRIPAEIILIGGASVLINYGFREMTYERKFIWMILNVWRMSYMVVMIRFQSLHAYL